MVPKDKMKRVAVLGASGFIGQNLTEYLSRANYEIIPVYFTHPVKYAGAIDFEDFVRSDKRIDAIVFSAGNSNHNVDNKDLFEIIKKDSLYIQTVFEKFRIYKAILLSSAAVYYGYEGIVDENTCPRPMVNYGISKRIAEMIFEKEAKKQQTQAVVLRLTYAFGKGERETRLFRSIAKSVTSGQSLKIHGKGESYINPVPVEFVCKVMEYFLNKDLTTNVDYYNLGSLKCFKVIEIVEKLKENFNFKYTFEGEEKQPVIFMTKTEKLAQLGITFDDVFKSVNRYIKSIIEQKQ